MGVVGKGEDQELTSAPYATMVTFYTFMFWACALLTAVATTYAQKSTQQVSGSKIGTSPAFKRFQFTYLCVYFMMMVRASWRTIVAWPSFAAGTGLPPPAALPLLRGCPAVARRTSPAWLCARHLIITQPHFKPTDEPNQSHQAGDWLQGPYVYALYDSYGYSQEDIAVLFVAGFGSSMFFGTFVGSLADRLGRKRFCLLYTGLYIASCLTKHVKSFHVLMLGRLLGGIATSLLFSVFDVSGRNRLAGWLAGSTAWLSLSVHPYVSSSFRPSSLSSSSSSPQLSPLFPTPPVKSFI